MKTKKKKSNMRKRARAGVKGLIVRWADIDPLRETREQIAGQIDHRNPVLRLCAQEVFRDFGEWITHKEPFRWLVKVICVFDYPNGTTQREERELEAFATIDAINEHCMECIEEMYRHGDMSCYRHTEFEIECVGVK
ncbi:hypothetical protein [Gilvimarinus chinensis]|uniref:hypothetical protein n=1 Tax=Gilvimarinus chinensis TaxID=396005 RepID=UPI0003610D1F|nr:hypothetical protein [Gilvimarinus chinensis]